jgi:hypothetical protein
MSVEVPSPAPSRLIATADTAMPAIIAQRNRLNTTLRIDPVTDEFAGVSC